MFRLEAVLGVRHKTVARKSHISDDKGAIGEIIIRVIDQDNHQSKIVVVC